jgi:CHAT domain-containing protein/Tfp pilus assembly protein PilF
MALYLMVVISEQNKGRLTTLTFRRCVIYCMIILASLFISELMSVIAGAQSQHWPPQPPVMPTSASQRDRDVRVLEMGKSIQRDLARGERHSYQISLRAHEFIHVVVEQRGIDVAVTFFGPLGQQITEIDSPNGAQGPERVLFITVVSGNYLLDIYARDDQPASGRYEVRLEEERSATQQDRNRLAAYQSVSEGQQLFAQATAPSLRKAINKFNEALPLWRLVEDRRAEAITLSQIGKGYDLLGEKVRALDFYNQALPLLQAVKDDAGQARTLNNIGLIYDSLGEKQEALRYYSRAIPILQAAGDRRVEAYTLNNLGLVYDSLGEKQKALDNYGRALQMLQAVGDRRAEAATLNNIGFVYNSLGNKDRALDYFGRALPILRAVGDQHVEAITINNVGHVYESLGEQVKALEYFNQALPILRLVGDRRVEAITLNNIGLVYSSLNENQKALEYFNRSLPLRRVVGDRQGEATTLADIGHFYASSDEHQRGLDYYSQALTLSKTVEDRSLESSILLRIAQVERDRGNLVEARKQIEAALDIIESLRTKIASQELRASYFASSQQYFETYIDLLMQSHSRHPDEGHDSRALQVSERARARSLLEMLTEARASIRQGVDPELLQRERSLQQTLNAKAATQNRLIQGDSNAEQVSAVRREIKLLLGQYHDLEAQIRINSPRYAALTQPSPLSLKEIQKRVLDSDTLLLEYALGAERSYLWMVTSNSLKSAELPRRGEIEIATRRVYELMTERNRWVKFETPTERQARIAAADAEYLKRAAALSQILLGPAVSHLGRRGKKRLLIVGDGALNYVPFAALPIPDRDTEKGRRGDAAINNNPSDLRVSASPRPRVSALPLIVEHEIVSLPSASTLGALRRDTAGRKLADKTLAVLADPVFERDDTRLKRGRIVERSPTRSIEIASTYDARDRLRGAAKNGAQASGAADGTGRIQRLLFTRREAEEILSLVPEADRMKALDFDASLMTAVSPELGHYRFVHFGTHGLLDSAHPELSGIVLSLFDRQGRELDGYLRVNEIFNLKLPVELVVLSGCRTGLGKEIKGEGLVGLTRGFMYAGAARIVVSLWDVSDEASARLMVHFYRGMLGPERLSPSAALRAAQIALWKDGRWQAPYYWAAFVLQGEPR